LHIQSTKMKHITLAMSLLTFVSTCSLPFKIFLGAIIFELEIFYKLTLKKMTCIF
jgi:hypothetical protein